MLLTERLGHVKAALTILRMGARQVGSTIIAQAAGVPTLPWSGSGVAIDYATCNGVVPVCHPSVTPLIWGLPLKFWSRRTCCQTGWH